MLIRNWYKKVLLSSISNEDLIAAKALGTISNDFENKDDLMLNDEGYTVISGSGEIPSQLSGFDTINPDEALAWAKTLPMDDTPPDYVEEE